MSVAIASVNPPARKPRGSISPRVRRAVEVMVRRGLTLDEAAASVGLNSGALASALGQGSVIALLMHEMDVLKASARPRAAHRIMELAHQNAALGVALKAAIYLDSDGASEKGGTVNVQVNVQPGYQVRVREEHMVGQDTPALPMRTGERR